MPTNIGLRERFCLGVATTSVQEIFKKKKKMFYSISTYFFKSLLFRITYYVITYGTHTVYKVKKCTADNPTTTDRVVCVHLLLLLLLLQAKTPHCRVHYYILQSYYKNLHGKE